MFEWDVEQTLLTEENEYKPNCHTALALRIGMVFMVISLFLNEVNIFHVDKVLLRVCAAIVIIGSLVPQFIVRKRELACDPRSKYIIMTAILLLTFGYTLGMFIFTTPVFILPMLIAVQYNSRRFTNLAVIGSCVCVMITPALGGALGLWSEGFMEYLLSSAIRSEVTYSPGAPINMGLNAMRAVGYISIPWLMTCLLFSRLVLSATRTGEENIRNQLEILKMGRTDALTGLFNQNAYQQFMESEQADEPIGVMFFDVDGLKATNDAYGHERGDYLLQCCAGSLKKLLDENCHGFRIGGDEFLLVVYTDDAKVLEQKLDKWKNVLQTINYENSKNPEGVVCSMSAGTAFGSAKNVVVLVHQADEQMYEMKKQYHSGR